MLSVFQVKAQEFQALNTLFKNEVKAHRAYKVALRLYLNKITEKIRICGKKAENHVGSDALMKFERRSLIAEGPSRGVSLLYC